MIAASILAWLLPIAVLVYVVRSLHTIMLGLRSINEGVRRMADAVERIEQRGNGQV